MILFPFASREQLSRNLAHEGVWLGYNACFIFFLCSPKAEGGKGRKGGRKGGRKEGRKEGVLESDTAFPRRDLRKIQSRSTEGVSPCDQRSDIKSRYKKLKGEESQGTFRDREGHRCSCAE